VSLSSLPVSKKHALPFIPATDLQLKNIKTALEKHGTNRDLIDIGSGDGRITRMAAEMDKFPVSWGIEINRWLVYYSSVKSLLSGQSSSTRFFKSDLWKHNFDKYGNIVIFGVGPMMSDLERKLFAEIDENTKIIACRFKFPNKTPIDTIGRGIDAVWVYDLNTVVTYKYNVMLKISPGHPYF